MKKIAIFVVAMLTAALAEAATLSPVQLLNPAGSTSGQAIVSTGPSTAPAWGSVAATALAPIAANSVVANKTGSTAAPTAAAVPSCSTANSALNWTSATGFGCGTAFALTSGNLSQFAATTSSQLLGVLSDETGSGAAVFGTTPTISQPNIVGTTTNNNANAGSVGEYICAQVTNGGSPTGCSTNTNTPVSLTTGVTANVTSISLAAGDWHVCGNIGFVAGGTTNVTAISSAIHTISAAFPVPTGLGAYVSLPIASQTGQGPILSVGCTRMLLASTTTVYLVVNSNFNTSTNAAIGFIAARRPR